MSVKYDLVSVSKAVGWNEDPLPIPPKEEVQDLIIKANQGNVDAAVKLFKYMRFCVLPKTEKEQEAIDMIIDACKKLFTT